MKKITSPKDLIARIEALALAVKSATNVSTVFLGREDVLKLLDDYPDNFRLKSILNLANERLTSQLKALGR